jgi:menaquinone-dependent protoporphyrinogen oxidase
MKTLILYATKHGACADIAGRIAKVMGEAQTHDLQKPGMPPLENFDCVIVGASLYAGSIRAAAKEFMKQNEDKLAAKKLGLFLSGMSPVGKPYDNYWNPNFSPKLLAAAKAKLYAGGAFDPQKAGFLERLIMRMVTKKSGYQSSISQQEIDKFAKEMNR